MKWCLMVPLLLISSLAVAEQLTEEEWLAAFEGCEVSDQYLMEPRIPSGASVLRNADFLVGKWEGTADYFSLSFRGAESSRVKVAHATEKITYRFSPDGRYTYESEITYRSGYGGHYYAGGGGTWGFENEILVLSQTTKRHNRNSWAFNFEKRLRVYSFKKDEIGFQYASNQDLLDFTMANEANAPSSWRPLYRVGHDQYGFEVVRRFRPEYGSGGISLASPSRFKRVTVPYVPKTTPMPSTTSPTHPSPTHSPSPSITPPPEPAKPPYVLERLEWVEGKDFALVFEVKLRDECSIRSFFGIQREFEDEIRQFYCLRYPRADARSLVFDFKPALKNGRITGQVEVLTITPVSLVYDPNTRRGKLAVKVVKMTEEQFETARAWIRKNIETLARDKNIALTTGVIPPAARFYLGREELKDGNVLEIEFKTE